MAKEIDSPRQTARTRGACGAAGKGRRPHREGAAASKRPAATARIVVESLKKFGVGTIIDPRWGRLL